MRTWIALCLIVVAVLQVGPTEAREESKRLMPAQAATKTIDAQSVPLVSKSVFKEATPIASKKVTPRAAAGSYTGNGASIIREVAAQMGCTAAEINMLLYIAAHEAGPALNVNAVSETGKYVGLFQLGPHLGTYSQRIDPYWNTARAIKYMRGRYGSIAAAYQFKRKNGWY